MFKEIPFRIKTKVGDLEVYTYTAYQCYYTKVIQGKGKKIASKFTESILDAGDTHLAYCKQYLLPLLKKEKE